MYGQRPHVKQYVSCSGSDLGQLVDQIFGQGVDQGLGEGKSNRYTVQYYSARGEHFLKQPKITKKKHI